MCTLEQWDMIVMIRSSSTVTLRVRWVLITPGHPGHLASSGLGLTTVYACVYGSVLGRAQRRGSVLTRAPPR